MTQAGDDGANLIDPEGRKVLLSKWLPRTARLILEADAATDGSGRILLRILQETRPRAVDDAATRGT